MLSRLPPVWLDVCEVSPTRKVLAKWSSRHVQSARDVMLERAANAKHSGDKASHELFMKAVDECNAELEQRIIAAATSAALDEGRKLDQQMSGVLANAIGR
jgi:hypothetical protein